MIGHLVVLPIILPIAAAMIQLLTGEGTGRLHRRISLGAILVLLGVGVFLLDTSLRTGPPLLAIGNWPAPYGIVLIADPLSGYMLVLTALTALGSLAYACCGWDRVGRAFHPLFLLQLAGLNGAFLTGDLFNLFVFFELLLIASYALLVYGGGRARLRAALPYVVINLIGSALFLVAIGLVYGVTGTLNMADLSDRVADLAPQDIGILRVAATLLLLVFGIKAAVVPLHFWLPASYPAAAAPVASMFAIMTKVGVYSILRIFTLIFDADAGDMAGFVAAWLLPAAQLTLLLGMVGTLASRTLGELVSYLLIASVGTLMTAVGLFTVDGIAAGLFYLAHSTLITAGLFLLVDLVARERGDTGTRLVQAAVPEHGHAFGLAFLVGGLAIVGLPPLSGFIGKAMILQSAHDVAGYGWIYAGILGSGVIGLIGYGRAGSLVFWSPEPAAGRSQGTRRGEIAAAFALISCSVALTVFAGPVVELTRAVAQSLIDPGAYVATVLGSVEHGN